MWKKTGSQTEGTMEGIRVTGLMDTTKGEWLDWRKPREKIGRSPGRDFHQVPLDYEITIT
jgi:hypothetical protein